MMVFCACAITAIHLTPLPRRIPSCCLRRPRRRKSPFGAHRCERTLRAQGEMSLTRLIPSTAREHQAAPSPPARCEPAGTHTSVNPCPGRPVHRPPYTRCPPPILAPRHRERSPPCARALGSGRAASPPAWYAPKRSARDTPQRRTHRLQLRQSPAAIAALPAREPRAAAPRQ